MSQYKYKLKEASSSKISDEFKIGDSKVSKGVKYTVTNIDKETGGVKWDVDYLPNFEELFETSTELVRVSKGVYLKAKDDSKFRDIYEESKNIRNKIRTHIRNEYPDDYRRMTVNIDEMSTTGGGAGAASFTSGTGAQYATPYAFRKKGQKTDDKAYKEIGYKSINEARIDQSKMFDQGLVDGIINQIREITGILEDEYNSDVGYSEYRFGDGSGGFAFKWNHSRHLGGQIGVSFKADGNHKFYAYSWYDKKHIGITSDSDSQSFNFKGNPIVWRDFNDSHLQEFWAKVKPMIQKNEAGAQKVLDAEAKAQSDYYGAKADTGRIGYGLTQQPRGRNLKEESNIDMDRVFMKGKNKVKFYVTVNRGHGDGKFLVKSSESEYTKPRIFSRDEAVAYVENAGKGGGTPGRQYAYWVSDINMDRIDENKERTSYINKSRAQSSLKQIEKGKRDDDMGKFTAKVFAIKDDKEIELKNLSDLDKYSTGYKYALKENVGSTLGPGPKAGPDGVKDSAYVN